MSNSQTKWLASLIMAAIVVVAGAWWLSRGYGDISAQTYEYSKALYSACLNRNELHLNKFHELLASDDAKALPATERKWLEGITEQARKGQWESAARKARRMMEDQVRY